jgi:nitrate reductase cytochrome c-type subunit
MKKFSYFILFVIIIVGALYVLSGNDYPHIPADADHIEITDKEICLECHGPESENKLKESHPPKYECFKCHKPEKIPGK